MKNVNHSIIVCIFTIAYCMVPDATFAQLNYSPTNYWWQMPLINPAASGVHQKVDVATGIAVSQSDMTQLNSTPLFFRADVKLASIKSGLGVSYFTDNYIRAFDSPNQFLQYSETVKINYNYQFQLNKAILSVGVSAFLKHAVLKYDFPTGSSNNNINTDDTQPGYALGSQYSRENWHIGICISPGFVTATSDGFRTNTFYHIDGAYSFNAKENANFLFGTSLDLINNSFQYLLFIQTTLYKKYIMGAQFANLIYLPEQFNVFFGYRINQWIIQYNYGNYISDLTSNFNAMHTISFRYVLGNK